jgi:hypothetical protein
MNKTIDYYENNAAAFVNGTLDVKFADIQDRFLSTTLIWEDYEKD